MQKLQSFVVYKYIVCTCLCRQCHECVLYILARKLCGIIITSTVPAIIQFIILWAPIYVHVSYITLYYLCIIVYSFDLYMFIFILLMYCTDEYFFYY